MGDVQSLRGMAGLPAVPAPLAKSALVMIDCQNTYLGGAMRLEGVDEAIRVAAALLDRARREGAHIIHIRHDDGPGSLYDLTAKIGQIADPVVPQPGETVIDKAWPSAFEGTPLDEELKRRGVTDLVYAGFMTHMCINSTARAGFNRGYAGTVVAAATATRALPNPLGGVIPAAAVHTAALAALNDLFAIVVPGPDGVP
ncbi:MAG: isochorismatase family protein [Geminicoccaceae bacterium]